MTDLTGVDLAEATAHVLGFRDDDHRWRHSGTFYIHRRPNEMMPEEWRPDQGGAAAWEVWVWLVAQCLGDAEIAGAKVAQQQHIADDYAPEHVPTYTCRAVVTLGEAG